MAKIAKRALKLHNEALDLVRLDRDLTMTEKELVIANYKPYADHNVTETNAFFTPIALAIAATIEMPNPDEYDGKVRILDLCSGIGILSFVYLHYSGYNTNDIKIVCVEYEEEFIEVGKKILPEATWIQGDILNPYVLEGQGKFDCFISNPPFMKMGEYKGTYTTSIVGMKVSEYGVVIVPQCNCPFLYSGQNQYTETRTPDYNKFEDAEMIKYSVSCIDTAEVIDDDDEPMKWDGVKVVTEVVIVEDLVKHPRTYPKPTFSK
jgi:SAM-dependent methyltransferase